MSSRPSVAVYDAYWSTGGGGESYAGGIAEVLRHDFDVTLLAHETFDVPSLAERLGLDLEGVMLRVVDQCADLEDVSAEFDVFFNASYRSHARNGAPVGVYVVHFPDQPGENAAGWQRHLMNVGGRLFGSEAKGVAIREGFYPPDLVRWQQVRWTDGRGVLTFDPVEAGSSRLNLWIGRFVERGEVRSLEIVVNGAVVRTVDIGRPSSKLGLLEPLRITLDLPEGESPHTVELLSNAERPGDIGGNGDQRPLGVPLVGITTGRHLLSPLLGRASILRSELLDCSWISTYEHVVSNSEFTRRWVRKWWGIDSELLEPPVGLRATGRKDQVILAVGRFFAPGRGHAKKQLEMVMNFRLLIEEGLTGWELHLVGGCLPVDYAYLEQVREAAKDLPVVIHVDASGSELDALYARASIFWHATGLGENLDLDPVRAEHFGITTVEAMSAGVVPVVFNAGGQSAIVSDGLDGFLFDDPERWRSATMVLVGQPDLRAEMAAAAMRRASRFGRDAFADRVEHLLRRS